MSTDIREIFDEVQERYPQYRDDRLVSFYNTAIRAICKSDEFRFMKRKDSLAVSEDTTLTGTVTFTNDSAAVTGSGTAFTTELKVGDYIYPTDQTTSYAKRVGSITSDTALTLSSNYDGDTYSGSAYRDREIYQLTDIASDVKNVIEVFNANGVELEYKLYDGNIVFDRNDIGSEILTVYVMTRPAKLTKAAIDATGSSAFTIPIPSEHIDVVTWKIKELCEIDAYTEPSRFVMEQYQMAYDGLVDDYMGNDYVNNEISDCVQNSDGTYIGKF